MADGVDDEIRKLRHLEAQAKGQIAERAATATAEALKTRAQKMAFEAQGELLAAQTQLAEGEAKQARARVAGTPPLEAADLITQGKAQARDAQMRVVKARARLNFALDQMDEVERKEWDALQAGARAEAHGQLASEP